MGTKCPSRVFMYQLFLLASVRTKQICKSWIDEHIFSTQTNEKCCIRKQNLKKMLFKILLQNNLNPWADQATCGYSLKTKPLQVKQQDTQLNQNFSVSLLAHNIILAELLTRESRRTPLWDDNNQDTYLLALVTRTRWGKPLTLVWHSPCALEAVALTIYPSTLTRLLLHTRASCLFSTWDRR